MRVFVLNTGRCGSHTFARACGHMTNFTAEHESRTRLYGKARLDYPEQHIEADNRLAWFVGRLHQQFPDARYVHLTRDADAVARSYASRWVKSPPPHEAGIVAKSRMRLGLGGRGLRSRITTGYAYSIITRREPWPDDDVLGLCRDYVDTVTANVVEFLRDKPHVSVHLETAADDFASFWDWIGAEGALDAALGEWSVKHDAGSPARNIPIFRRRT